MKTITDIFDKMDRWRNLPNYQLERRADIFFAAYLKTVLEVICDTKLKGEIIPEFPVHIATIYPNIRINKSFKIDYLAFSEDNTVAFLIELKTDIDSRREKQDEYLKAAANVGLAELIRGLIEIFRATNSKRKYFYLFKMLKDAGIVELPNSLRSKVFSDNMTGVNALVSEVRIITPIRRSKVIYIQPVGDGKNVITFSEFGSLIERIDDPVTRRFIESLKKWSVAKAGDTSA